MKKGRDLFNISTFHMSLVVTLLLLCSCTFVKAESTYPKPTDLKYINDYTSTLDDSTKQYIVSVGKELEDKTGAQAVVVLIESLQGSDIEPYANELFRTWGIGQKDKNNGLLVLVSIKDKRWRVEVGTSLEGAIPDIFSARVMDSLATPNFKNGDYSEGIKASYSVFADSIAKEYSITLDKNEKINLPSENNATGNRTSGLFAGILVVVLIVLDFIFNRGRITLFIMSIAFLFGRGRGGGGGRSGGNGGGGLGGMGGGSSSGGGSSGNW